MSGPRAPHSLRHEPQTTPLKFEEPLYEAELAVHNGDAAPRRALWSRNEPVSVLGALRNASVR
jgi:hypothetical protein